MKLSLVFVAAALGLANAQSCPALGQNLNLPTTAKLPDPFTFFDGTKATKENWQCRKDEISQLMQRYVLGTFPPKPSSVTGSFSGNRLTINVSEAGKSISFSVTINKPSGSGPFPAIIAYGAASIPVPSGVATIVYNNDEIGQQQGQSSRGRGKFYDIYGSGHSAGALTAWAWGVGRIIDALESSTGHNIDPKRIGVTGCSRNGKGAIVAGALEQRIALSLPQESGSGGAACWRLSDAQKARGQNVQTASQIISENVWLGTPFNQYVNQVTKLPVDHHFLAAMTAPRGLFVIENTSMEWLGNMSVYGCMAAGQKIYEALGIKGNFGLSQIGGHNHCQFPSSQQSELTAFINRFLLNGNTTPNVFRTDASSSTLNFDASGWMPWSVPNLS